MKKFKLLMLCAAMLVASAIGLTACSDPETNELTFNVPKSVTAEVGEYFALPSIVAEDSNGDIYPLRITVTDPNEDEVIVENDQIFVDYIGEYKAVYTVTFEGQDVSKTMKIESKDTTKPTIALDSLDVYELSGTEDYVVPVPTYSDNYTPSEQLTTSMTVSFGNQKIDPVDGKIALTDTGKYTVKYTATDASGNTAEEILTIHSFAGEPDTVTYFNRSFAADHITLLADVGSIYAAQDVTAPGDEYSLKFSAGANATGYGGLYINRPYIKDITDYEYLYFYVYTDTADVGVTFNAIYSSHRLNVGVWNKIVLKKTVVDGDKIDYMTPWGTRVFYDEYSGTCTADPTDITDFLVWLYIPAETGANVWFSSIKGAHSMPESEVAMEQVCTNPIGTVDIPTGTIAGADNVTQKVYAEKDGLLTEVKENTYTFNGAGAYKFYFYLLVDGKLADIVEKNILVIENEEDNLTYFNREFAAQNVSNNGMTGKSVSSDEKTIPGEDYALKHTNNSATGNSCIVVDKAYKKDITEYKYLYFYIWINKANSGVTFNGIWSPDRSLVPGVWNRIVLTRNAEGTNYTTPWGTNVFNETVTPTDMDGFMFFIYQPVNEDTTIYLSAMRGTNEELPEAEVELADKAEKGVPFAIPTATGVEDITQKVYLVQGNTVTDITEEESYTFTENGVYSLAFEVYSAGKLVNTVQKTVFVYDEEPGNITYFNQPFGISSVGALNSVGAGISTNTHMVGDASSLECYLQAPGYWPSLELVNPFIKNLNEKEQGGEYLYNYVVFYAYTTDALKTRIKIGAAQVGEFIPAGVWTRIVLVRNGENFSYNGVNVFNETITANDISGLQFVFDMEKESAAGTIFLSTFMAVKEIEQPEIEITFDEYYFEGAEIGVTATTEEGYVVKTYYQGQEYTEATFVAANAGTYDFMYRVFKDGVLYATYTKTVSVVGNEADNLTYFNRDFGKDFAVEYNEDTTISPSQKTTYGEEEYSLEITVRNPSYWGVGGVYLRPTINDITPYKYLYFYVYTDMTGLTFHGTTTAVPAGTWTKVVLVRQDDNSFVSQSFVGNKLTISAARAADMNASFTAENQAFGILLVSKGTEGAFPGYTFCISAVRVTNSLAEENAVLNLSTSQGASELGNVNSLVFGASKAQVMAEEECSTEFYLQAPGFQPTVRLTAPAISNLNAKDAEDNYLYDYVYFYVYSTSSATSLTIHYATGEILPANTWKMLVLERRGDTYIYNGAAIFGDDGVTADNITNLGLCFDTTGESNFTSVYMTSWRAVKTLPQQ